MKIAEEHREKMKKRNKDDGIEQFEFCKLCKLNHSNGRRHIYFPNHIKALSSLLSRFARKLSDLRFFLNYPSLLRPEHASLNSLWCIFCDFDVSELGSSYACENAITHLSSKEHSQNVKDFMWRYGGKDRVDSFRVSDEEFEKWKNRCKSLKTAAKPSGEGSIGPSTGPLKDIHQELSSVNMDRFEKKSYCFGSSVSNGVLPLQSYTNERFQVSYTLTEGSPLCRVGEGTEDSCTSSKVREVQRLESGEGSASGLALQSLTQIHSLPSEASVASIHTGAPPPWMEIKDETEINHGQNGYLYENNIMSQSKKTRKLNPKRVGAAWAEKRKAELEREKRGETVSNSCDEGWLPNFGRVWQAGTRKDSRKEFETETRKLFNAKNPVGKPEPIKIEPYVSKRMRKESIESKSDANAQKEETANT